MDATTKTAKRMSKDENNFLPAPPIEKLSAPTFLNEEAQSVFLEYADYLNSMGLLAVTDLPLLAVLAEYSAQFRIVTEMLHNKDLTVKGVRGHKVLNPLLRQQKLAAAMSIDLAKQYCMTPYVRAKLGITGPIQVKESKKEKDVFDDL